MDPASELEQLAQRVAATVTMIASKAVRFVRKLLVGVTVVCIGSFLLGIAAFHGTARSVWIVVGAVFAAIAIGGPLLAMWRIGLVSRHAPELVDEVRTLVTEGPGVRSTVIDTFDAEDPERPADTRSAITLTREVAGLRGLIGSGVNGSARLTAAVTALTRFPATVLSAIAITVVFAFLAVIFLVALAL